MSAASWSDAARAAVGSAERTQQVPALQSVHPGGRAGADFTAAVGTPLYMAPEQIAGERPTPAADQYALAASAWEMIGGNRMRGGDFNAVLLQAHNGAVPAPPDGFPRAAVPVLQRALAKAPVDRFPTAGAFAEALRDALLPGTSRKVGRRRLLLGLGAAAGVLLAGGATTWFALSADKSELILVVTPGNRAILAPVYEPLARYLSERIGRPFRVAIPGSYDQVLDGLDEERFHVALLSPVPYVNAKRRIPELVLLGGRYFEFSVPYRSVVLKRKDVGAGPLPDALRGLRYCFVDPKSTSGYLVPTSLLLDAGIDPKKDALELRFSGDHYNVLKDLSEGACDVGAVSAMQLADAPRQAIPVDDIEVVMESETLPPLAVVAHPSLPEDTVNGLREALFGATADPKVSDDLGLSEEAGSFRPVDDSAYDVIRRIEKHVGESR